MATFNLNYSNVIIIIILLVIIFIIKYYSSSKLDTTIVVENANIAETKRVELNNANIDETKTVESNNEKKSYFMHGPYIGYDKTWIPIQKIVNINDENIYIIQDAEYVKMVSDSGIAKAYIGLIDEFSVDKWNNASRLANGVYKLNICSEKCSKGCSTDFGFCF